MNGAPNENDPRLRERPGPRMPVRKVPAPTVAFDRAGRALSTLCCVKSAGYSQVATAPNATDPDTASAGANGSVPMSRNQPWRRRGTDPGI
jgi:hypothetical protein